MTESTTPLLSELIDRVEAMREELLAIQRAMEKIESKEEQKVSLVLHFPAI